MSDFSASLSTIVSPEMGALRGGGTDDKVGLAVRLKVGAYFALWYILNIVYNSEYRCLNFTQHFELKT